MAGTPHAIVHFSTVHPTTDVRVRHKECASLARAGYRVTLYARGDAETTAEGVVIKPVPTYPNRLRRVVVGPISLLKSLLRERADLYHFHDPELLPIGFILRLLGKRVIYDAHEWVRGDVASKPYLHPLAARGLGRVVAMMEWIAGRWLTHTIAATPFIAGFFPRSKVTTIHNYPFLTPRAFETVQRSDGLVVYVGGISEERCGRELIEAVRIAHQHDTSVRMVAGGGIEDGIQVPDCEAFTHLGFLDRQAVARLLSTAQIGIVLLRDMPNTRDALPTKFFEYLDAGLAVIVSQSTIEIAAITRAVGCGLVVDETQPQAIAEAINQLVADPQMTVQMGRRGASAVAEHYQWAAEEDRLLELYERLLCAT